MSSRDLLVHKVVISRLLYPCTFRFAVIYVEVVAYSEAAQVDTHIDIAINLDLLHPLVSFIGADDTVRAERA